MEKIMEIPENKYICLDYLTLVSEYENRLTSMERGFSMDHDFIDLWVPDDDPNKSLFYLFEAASMRSQKGLTVSLSAQLISAIDGEGLTQALQEIGSVSIEKRS